MIITEDDKYMIDMIRRGNISVFKMADIYLDKDKYWTLIGFIPLIKNPYIPQT